MHKKPDNSNLYQQDAIVESINTKVMLTLSTMDSLYLDKTFNCYNQTIVMIPRIIPVPSIFQGINRQYQNTSQNQAEKIITLGME